MSIQIRTYRERDLPLIVVLNNAAEAVDRVEQGTSIQEQGEELADPRLKAGENVFVAEDEEGRLVAYAWLFLVTEASESGFRTWLNVHPMFRGRGLEGRLLTRLEERARERIGEAHSERVYLACAGHAVYEDRLRAIERAGMKEVRRFWVMLRPDLEGMTEPAFSPGLIVRPVRLGEDDVEALDAQNDAFSEHFGFSADSLEWWEYYLHSKKYRPELSVLAIDAATRRVAGFCHIAVSEGECERIGRRRGWIDILGVRTPYRHRGLGKALLWKGLHNLHAAGLQEAALGCDSENTTGATKLYLSVGFHEHRTTITYAKYLSLPASKVEPSNELALAAG